MKRILIVDDEPAITSALEYYFTTEGYEVLLAHSGKEAFDQLALNPDIVILDIMLPDVDGYRISQEIRNTSANYIPILMLTAKGTSTDRIVGLDMGADAYFTKPYNPQELLAQIRALMRFSGGVISETLTCLDLTLWPNEGICEKNGDSLNLSTTEFQILTLLMENRGQVLGRQTILRRIWGYEATEVTTRTIDTHIQRLRKKIEEDPKEPTLLITVRGFGYRLTCGDA